MSVVITTEQQENKQTAPGMFADCQVCSGNLLSCIVCHLPHGSVTALTGYRLLFSHNRHVVLIARCWQVCPYQLQATYFWVESAVGDDQDAGDLFDDDEPIGMTKRELYKQNKEAKQMERLTRRMQGAHCCVHPNRTACTP